MLSAIIDMLPKMNNPEILMVFTSKRINCPVNFIDITTDYTAFDYLL